MTTYLTGRCEINLDRREVQVNGVLRAVGPKVFKLLVLLLQQRHRVVSKAELVEQIWHGALLSDSVLARNVMLARRAIDDGTAGESPIRNLHGQGYRFVGEVQVQDTPATDTGQAPRLVIALLPCTRTREDPRLALAGQGFMAMVGDALRAAGLETPAITELLQAHARIGTALPAAERAQLARRQLPCSHVVVTAVRPVENALWLDYSVFGDRGLLDTGSLRDTTMALLAARLGEALVQQLLSAAPTRGPATAVDPFVSEALARAEELMAHELWADAEALYHAVQRLAPGRAAVLAWRLNCLVPMRDPRTTAVAQQLLAHPHCASRPDLAGAAHMALALHLHRQRSARSQALARRHRAEATRLAQTPGDARWSVLWRGVQARMHLEAGEPELARASALHAQSAAQQHGHLLLQALAQQQLALLDTMTGDLLQAQQRLQALSDGHLQHRRLHSAAQALAWQALCSCELGMFKLAEDQAARVLDLLADREALGHLATLLSKVALVLLDTGQRERMTRVLQQLARATGPAQASTAAPQLATRGAALLLQGQAAEGRALIEAAISVGLTSEGVLWARAWGLLLLRLYQAAGQWASAKRVRDGLAGLPGHCSDPMLQGALSHARACDAWRQGRRRASMVMLQQLIDEFPSTRAEATARMDLAWMLLDDGDLLRAERLLAGCGAWRHQHPSGLAAQARLHHARGQHDDAVRLQLQALREHRGPAPAQHSALAQAYAEAAAGGPHALPVQTCWISLGWLPA